MQNIFLVGGRPTTIIKITVDYNIILELYRISYDDRIIQISGKTLMVRSKFVVKQQDSKKAMQIVSIVCPRNLVQFL